MLGTVIEELRAYLNADTHDYKVGLALLISYGNKPATCEQLERYPDRDKLLQLLNDLFDKLVGSAPVATPEIKNEIRQGNISMPIQAPVLGQLEREVLDEIKANLKEIDSLKGELYHIGRENGQPRLLSEDEKKRRLEVARKLISLNRQSHTLFADLKHVKENGTRTNKAINEIDTEDEEQPSGDYLKYENARKQHARLRGKISQGKSQLEELSGKDKEKMLRKLNDWQVKLEMAELNMEKFKPKDQ